MRPGRPAPARGRSTGRRAPSRVVGLAASRAVRRPLPGADRPHLQHLPGQLPAALRAAPSRRGPASPGPPPGHSRRADPDRRGSQLVRGAGPSDRQPGPRGSRRDRRLLPADRARPPLRDARRRRRNRRVPAVAQGRAGQGDARRRHPPGRRRQRPGRLRRRRRSTSGCCLSPAPPASGRSARSRSGPARSWPARCSASSSNPSQPCRSTKPALDSVARIGGIALANFRLRERLVSSEERYRTLFEESPDALLVSALDGTVLDANEAAVRLYRVNRGEVLGRYFGQLISADEREMARRRQIVWAQGRGTFSDRGRRPDGSEFPVEVEVRVVELGGQRRFLLAGARPFGPGASAPTSCCRPRRWRPSASSCPASPTS